MTSQPKNPLSPSGPPVLTTVGSTDGETGVVVFVAVEAHGVRIDVDPSGVSADRIEVALRDGRLAAGQQDVAVLHLDSTKTRVLAASNRLPLRIVPVIRALEVTASAVDRPPAGKPSARDCTSGLLTLEARPMPKPGQHVGALLNEIQGEHAHAFPAAPASFDQSRLSIPFTDVVPGHYLVRLQVDEVRSRLLKPPGQPFQGPRVEIPPSDRGRDD